MSGMTSERLAEILLDALARDDHLTAENVTLRHAYMAHAEVCDHDEPTVLGQLDNARQNVLDLTAEVARLRAGIEELTSVGYSHTPDCEADDWQRVAHGGHPDCGLCWEDKLATLLNPPTEGETDE